MFPFRNTDLVAALKNCVDSSSTVISHSAQGREGSVCFSHGHRVCIAIFNHFRLGMPSPPAHLGDQTSSRATKHWPPFASLCAHYRNPLQILIIAFIVFFGRPSAIIVCNGIALSTDYIRNMRPLLGMFVAFRRLLAECERQSQILAGVGAHRAMKDLCYQLHVHVAAPYR